MAAVQETVDRVKSLDVTEYKYGFFSQFEMDMAPQGPQRGHRPLHLGQEGRAPTGSPNGASKPTVAG